MLTFLVERKLDKWDTVDIAWEIYDTFDVSDRLPTEWHVQALERRLQNLFKGVWHLYKRNDLLILPK